MDPRSFFDSLNLPKPSSFPNPREVRTKARELSKKIFDNWTLLNRILERHEETIQKRWLKKAREQRRKILLAAWPGISLSHRPDIEAFIREKRTGPTEFRDAYMWPHINQEDLLKPKLFLIFLNARGRNYPSAFAAADHDSIRLSFTSGKVTPAFLNGYVMMFTERNTPDTYGELLSWDDHEDAFFWFSSHRGLHPGEGLQVLEIQDRVYGFLLECCLQILHDQFHSSLTLDDTPIQPEPPALSVAEPGLNSLAAIAAEAPYRLPESLDLTRLQALVAAKRSAVEDHIWSLREDPSYFADVVLDNKEHRQELLLDTNGHQHSLLKPYASNRFWDRVLRNVIVEAYFTLAIWDDLHSQICHIQSLKQKLVHEIIPGKDLPSELQNSLLKLNFSLEQYTKGPILALKTVVPPSPPLRSSFVRLPERGDANIIRVESKASVRRDKTLSRLMWMFGILWDDSQRHLIGLHTLVDEMERFLQSETRIKHLLSSQVAGTIADLATLSECQHQISLFQPWAACFEDEAAKITDDLHADYIERSSVLQELDTVMKHLSLADLGDPSDGKFVYPVDKRKTRENTEAMQRAEKHLDQFWEKLDEYLMEKMDLSRHGALLRLLSEDRILHRTMSWVEPDPATLVADRQVEDLCKPLSQFYFELEHRTQSTIDHDRIKTPKVKIKTRNLSVEAQSSIDQQPEVAQPNRVPDTQPVFKLGKRSMKVFSILFHKPSFHSQPGEFPWNDFLHAMRETGFHVEKLYGSVWQFKPSTLDVERSIQFHEPHPISKIPFRTARRFGRRLSRAYGWHLDMFILDTE